MCNLDHKSLSWDTLADIKYLYAEEATGIVNINQYPILYLPGSGYAPLLELDIQSIRLLVKADIHLTPPSFVNPDCFKDFNVYGPRQDPNSQYAAVIPRFINRTLEQKPPIIFGDGEQTRDFTFIKDAVAETILAAENDATGIFNVGTGNRVTINELAKLVVKFTGRELEPVHHKPRPGDIRHSLAAIAKAKETGYNPRYGLEEGLKETIREWH